ncbi:hypothetical protein ARMGADRAFT_1111159 [Armillaria gallica]|uniref:Aminoacyl-tRNA synthetase class II (D/K/N) domain-containing protein n=1 Tax=Armillaria gallica TaxID=47427 RepID=A0A2H3D5W0_ARMGA|nr:hypothetical protein ARMGADRAFT_1111159 [Armillaria gallica]
MAPAYLTQRSLETCLPSLGNVFCVPEPHKPFKRMSYFRWRVEHGIKHAVEDAEGNIILDESGHGVLYEEATSRRGRENCFTQKAVISECRISDMEELLAAYKHEGIDSAPYYWFADCGYGLGVERFIAWLVNTRECSLYPSGLDLDDVNDTVLWENGDWFWNAYSGAPYGFNHGEKID